MTTLTPGALRGRILVATRDAYNKARHLYHGLPDTCPPVTIDLRGRAAGMVRFRGTRVRRGHYRDVAVTGIRYNPGIARDNPREFVATTVPHEVAHVVALLLGGNGTHDATWQHICESLGGERKRTHSMSVPAAQDRRVTVQCGCPGGIKMGPVQYKRMTAGRRYTCRQCGERCHP